MTPLDVLVVGEALIDVVESGDAVVEHVGGSPANVALGLGRLGDDVTLLTQLGEDRRGSSIVAHLSASGVAVRPESVRAGATSTALARIDADGQATYEFDVRWEALGTLDGIRPRLIHTGSIACFLAPGAESVRRLLRACGAAEVTFDPNIRPALIGPHAQAFRAYEQTAALASVVKLSDEDAAWLYPGARPEHVVDEVLGLGPRLVAITLGARGAIVASRDARAEVEAVAVDAVDTIGAGDTFMASLAHSVLRTGSAGLDAGALRRIGAEAVRAAALTVSRAGADLPWSYEL